MAQDDFPVFGIRCKVVDLVRVGLQVIQLLGRTHTMPEFSLVGGHLAFLKKPVQVL